MRQLQSKIQSIWDAEASRRILWLPLWLAVGIGVYFLLPSEPDVWVFIAPAGICFAASIILRKIHYKSLIFIIFLILLGAGGATFRTMVADAPVLSEPLKNADVIGRVAEKSVTEKGFKLLLAVETISGLEAKDAPRYASVSLRGMPVEPAIGDRVSVRATLYPPPRPAYPGGFDFQRYFYFKQVGAMGFGLPNTLKIEASASDESTFMGWIEKLRYSLTQRIKSSIREPYGVIAAAFITGDTKGIPTQTLEIMRISGVYHLLAVSGMNLVIVSGILFFLARALLAAIPWVAIRLHTKKWAAGFALIGTYFYLLIAGSPVSAERAYVMVVLILSAIILDRQVTPMRSLMLAAIVILLVQPESLLNASFHLSFCATLGLIAWFELTQDEYKKRDDESRWHWKIRFYLEAVLLSSFVAWVSTMPFIMYHFQQISVFSLPANMLCVPLISVVTMPALIAALLLMPLGLEGLPMKLVEWTLVWMVDIASWFSSQPAALKSTPPITDMGIILIALGMLWCSIWLKPWRSLGLVLCLLGLLTMFQFKQPDILLGEEGRQVAFRHHDSWVLAKGQKGMQVEQWKEWLGLKEFVMRKNAIGVCDRTGCNLISPEFSVSVVLQRAILQEECLEAGLVIALLPRAFCKDSPVINSDDLTRRGAAAIWLTEGGYDIRFVTNSAYKRPWIRSAIDEDVDSTTAPE